MLTQQQQQQQQQQQRTPAHILIMDQPRPQQKQQQQRHPLFSPQDEHPAKMAKALTFGAGRAQRQHSTAISAISTTTAPASASSSSSSARSSGSGVAGFPAVQASSTPPFNAHAIQQHVLHVLLPQYLSVSLQNTPHSEDEKAAAQRRHKAALLKAMASAYAQPFVLGFLRTLFTGVWEEIEATARPPAIKNGFDSSIKGTSTEEPLEASDSPTTTTTTTTAAAPHGTSARGRRERVRRGLRERMQRQRWLPALRRVLVQIGATADFAEHTLMALTSAVLSHTMRLRVRHILQKHAATEQHRSLADAVVADPSARLLDVCREVARHDSPILHRHCSRTCSPVAMENTTSEAGKTAADKADGTDDHQQAYLRRSVLLDVYKTLLRETQKDDDEDEQRQQQQQQQQYGGQEPGSQQEEGEEEKEKEERGQQVGQGQGRAACENNKGSATTQQHTHGTTHVVREKMLQVAWRMERLFKQLIHNPALASSQKENDASPHSSGCIPGSDDATRKVATAPRSASPAHTAAEESAKATVTRLSMQDRALRTAWHGLLRAVGACDAEVLQRVVKLDGKQQVLMLATFAQRFYHTRRQHQERYIRLQRALLKASPASSSPSATERDHL